jgi:hypothetical protein
LLVLLGSVLQSFGVDRAAIAKVGEDVGELLGDPAEVARVTPVGGLGGLLLLVGSQAAGDALQQVLRFGVALGVAAGGGFAWSIALWCSS